MSLSNALVWYLHVSFAYVTHGLLVGEFAEWKRFNVLNSYPN